MTTTKLKKNGEKKKKKPFIRVQSFLKEKGCEIKRKRKGGEKRREKKNEIK